MRSTGIFIVARMGSTRLPGKHLKFAGGKMFIEWIVERFYFKFRNEISDRNVELFIVTSEKKENYLFEKKLENKYPFLSFFYGDDRNIPLRQLQCAATNNIDQIISVDGDDILCSVEAASEVRSYLMKGFDFVKTEGLPLGMNIMGFATSLLKTSLVKFGQTDTLETGWTRVFGENKPFVLDLAQKVSDPGLRFTLDYEDDEIFFRNVIEYLGNEIISIEDRILVSKVVENEFYRSNMHLNDQYWKNFGEQMKKE